jgi:glutaconate CoA-transferase subunit A
VTGKVCSMREAIARHVPDGAVVALGLGLESCIPFAAGHELIRQERRALTLVGPISDMLFDQLIGAGCVARIQAAWVGNVAAGSAYNFRRAVEQGVPRALEVEDHSNFTVGLALKAAAMGVPFLPTHTALGTEIANGPGYTTITSPFSGESLGAVRAIHPDVAIVHVQRADAEGNAHLWGNLGLVVEGAAAAQATIVVCEELVDAAVIRSDPNRTMIPGLLVAAVVREPLGAHPSPVQGYVNRDHAAYLEYHAESRTPEAFQRWLDTWVLGVPDRPAYLERLGGERRQGLRVRRPAPAALADFGM